MNIEFERTPDWPWPYERFAAAMREMEIPAPSVEDYETMVRMLDVLMPDLMSKSPEMHPDAAQIYREYLTPELRDGLLAAVVSEYDIDEKTGESLRLEFKEAIESPLRNMKPSFFPE